jgi:hypothetical protein
MRIAAAMSAISVVALLGLAACGDGGDNQSKAPAETTTTSAPPKTRTTSAPPKTTTTGGGATGPAPGKCLNLNEAASGVYPVGEAGEVEVRRSGGRLTLVEARPAEGWQASGDDAKEADEVEVDFRRGGSEIEFDAEIHVGRMEIEVCHND